jgi:hypothetical protein
MTHHTYFRFVAPTPATTAAVNWRTHAACQDVDPEVMFPGKVIADINEAKRVCAACPVLAECLTAAMAEEGATAKENRWGVRGGLTPTQRRRKYEQRAAQDKART